MLEARFELSTDLEDEVIVVTGGAGVLGSIMTRALAQCGARVSPLSVGRCCVRAGGAVSSGWL